MRRNELAANLELARPLAGRYVPLALGRRSPTPAREKERWSRRDVRRWSKYGEGRFSSSGCAVVLDGRLACMPTPLIAALPSSPLAQENNPQIGTHFPFSHSKKFKLFSATPGPCESTGLTIQSVESEKKSNPPTCIFRTNFVFQFRHQLGFRSSQLLLTPTHREAMQRMAAESGRMDQFARPTKEDSLGKRRYSLESGAEAFRTRMSSIVSYDSDQSPRDSMEEKHRLLHNAQNFPPLLPGSARLSKRWIRLLASAVGVVFIMLVGASLLVAPRGEEGESSKVRQLLADYGLLELPTTCENPWIEYGRMVVDQRVPENNRWVAYDLSCTTPELMAALRIVHANTTAPPLVLPLATMFPHVDNSLPFPWLHNRTVLLFGDHVERQHALDFCALAGGSHLIVNSNHPLSPPRFVNGIDEKFLRSDRPDHDDSRPSVCYLEKYNFMIVTVFHYGLANRVEFERESLLVDPHFYPPGSSLPPSQRE